MAPHVRATGAAVRVGVNRPGAGGGVIALTLSKAKYEELGKPETANVFIGDGDDDGQVLVQFDQGGDHKFIALPRGAAKLRLPGIAGMPQGKFKPKAVAFEQDVGEGDVPFLNIRLPW
jgi:hypothetical protein